MCAVQLPAAPAEIENCERKRVLVYNNVMACHHHYVFFGRLLCRHNNAESPASWSVEWQRK